MSVPTTIAALPAATPSNRLDHLLDVASAMFLEHGFERTSVSAIARRAKASKETFYSRYPTKGDLFRAVMQRRMDQFASEFALLLPEDKPPEIALAQFGRAVLDRLLSPEAVAMHRIVMTESRNFPELALIFFQQGPARIFRAFSVYYESQVAIGVFERTDTRVAAGVFLDLLTAELTTRACLGLLHGPLEKTKADKVRQTIDLFQRLYGRGRSTPP